MRASTSNNFEYDNHKDIRLATWLRVGLSYLR